MSEFNSPGDLARAYQHRTKKRFGQHFLTDPSILTRIADAIRITESDRVLEVGPGCGTLTWTLMERGASVVAVEIDRDAVAFLQESLVPEGLTLVEADATDVDFAALMGAEGFKVCANLPYNVATPITMALLEKASPGKMALMYQKEVARRMCAEPGSKEYSSLSLAVWLRARAQVAFTLPPGAFSPPPKVDSAVVIFDPIAGTRIADSTVRDAFERAVRAGFSQRRKTILNSFSSGIGLSKDAAGDLLEQSDIDPRTRAERIPPESFVRLAEELAAHEKGEESR